MSRDHADGPQAASLPVVIGVGSHPFPFRTRKLSQLPPMVLHGKLCGRVGRCRHYLERAREHHVRGLFSCTRLSPVVGTKHLRLPPRLSARSSNASVTGGGPTCDRAQRRRLHGRRRLPSSGTSPGGHRPGARRRNPQTGLRWAASALQAAVDSLPGPACAAGASPAAVLQVRAKSTP